MSGTKPYMAPEVFMCALEEISKYPNPHTLLPLVYRVGFPLSNLLPPLSDPFPLAGYSYPVDWWSLGVVAYEMRANIRPFVVHSNTPLVEVKNTLLLPLHFPRHWSEEFCDLISKVSASGVPAPKDNEPKRPIPSPSISLPLPSC